MSILNVVCPICTERFKNAEDIYSTSCGHIFHLSCLNDWQRQGTSCPQCRHYNPTTHKIYLSFEDSDESPEKLIEIEFNFLHLQEQFTDCEKTKRELEEKIRQMNDNEENFLQLQAQYTESSELINQLQSQILDLSIENERNTRELRLKCMEIETMNSDSVEGVNNTSNHNVVNDKVKILEQKLKLITLELEKEITTSTQLKVENMKLQSHVNRFKFEHNSGNPTRQENGFKNRFDNTNKTRTDKASDILIKDIPLSQLTKPYQNVVISLATKMNISITQDDLIKVNLVNDKAQLHVQFKTNQLKMKFLSNKKLLKDDSLTSCITISEYVDDELHSLLLYAKEKLKDRYNHFFYKNNQICAKKNRGHPAVLRIKNKAHVDSLINNHKTIDPKISSVKTVDENYYQK